MLGEFFMRTNGRRYSMRCLTSHLKREGFPKQRKIESFCHYALPPSPLWNFSPTVFNPFFRLQLNYCKFQSGQTVNLGMSGDPLRASCDLSDFFKHCGNEMAVLAETLSYGKHAQFVNLSFVNLQTSKLHRMIWKFRRDLLLIWPFRAYENTF